MGHVALSPSSADCLEFVGRARPPRATAGAGSVRGARAADVLPCLCPRWLCLGSVPSGLVKGVAYERVETSKLPKK